MSGNEDGEIIDQKISTKALKMETSLKEYRSKIWNILINSKNDRAISTSAFWSYIEWDYKNYAIIAWMLVRNNYD